jgi:hypothetical protein
MTPQAKKRRRLKQQMSRHCTVGIVAVRAVFFDRRVLINERALFVRVAFVARQIDRILV